MILEGHIKCFEVLLSDLRAEYSGFTGTNREFIEHLPRDKLELLTQRLVFVAIQMVSYQYGSSPFNKE